MTLEIFYELTTSGEEEQELLSAILDISAREIQFDPNAEHSCRVEPFLIRLDGETDKNIKIITERGETESPAVLVVRNMPEGIEAVFPRGDRVGFVRAPFQEIEVSIAASPGSQKGSFNVIVIFAERQGRNAVVNTQCQFNLISQ